VTPPDEDRLPIGSTLSKDDYDAMTETAYLLRNPANAERLLESIEQARRGEFGAHDLSDA
jgi:antitoxin YefM